MNSILFPVVPPITSEVLETVILMEPEIILTPIDPDDYDLVAFRVHGKLFLESRHYSED